MQKYMPQIWVIVLVGLVLAAIYNHQTFRKKEGYLTVEPSRDEPGTVIFYWRDGIDYPMSAQLRDAYEALGPETRRIVLDLHSPGGAVAEGRVVIGLIDKMKRTHQVDTHVGPRGACLSMCVPIYLQGERRRAAASARFMFHEPRKVEVATNRRRTNPSYEAKLATHRFVRRYFERSEMNPAWLDQLTAQWEGKDIWRTARELVDEDANVVQEIY